MESLPPKEILLAAGYLLSIAAGGVLCGRIVVYLAVKWVKWPVKKWRFSMQQLRAPILLLFPVLLYFIATHFYRPEALKTAPFAGTVRVLLVVAFAWLGIRATRIVSDLLALQFDITAGDNLAARRMHTQIGLVRRIVNTIICLLALAAIFLMSGSMRGLGMSLLTSAGVVGIIIGFSAQRLLGNLLAGIQLALTQPIRIDDVVVIEGEWGRIEEITLTYVVVHIWDHRRLVVPISHFIEKPAQNWTRSSAELLRTVSFYLDYDVPMEPLREKLKEILESSPYWDRQTGVLQVVNCTPETVEVRALMSVANAPNGWELTCEVREKMLAFIQSAYPQALPKTRTEISVGAAEKLKTAIG